MTFHLAAQVAASADASVGRSLHLISLIRGRLDTLEAAIAGQDIRRQLVVLTELADLLDELLSICPHRETA